MSDVLPRAEPETDGARVAERSAMTDPVVAPADDQRPRFVPPAPPRTPKAAATRRRLLELASSLFIERGYDAVSMRDIAVAADLTKGAVYGHFRSKGQILVEVIRWKLAAREHSPYFTEMVADPDRALDLLYDDDGREIRLLEVDAAAAARHDPDIAAGLAELYRERQAAIRNAVAGVSDPETVAWLISALSAGIGMKEAARLAVPATKRLHATLRAALGDRPSVERSRRA